MNTPIVVILSGPEKTRAKAELALEKANLTIIPPKEWPIQRESYRAEHWPHLTALPSGQPPDDEHGFVAVLAETEAAFHAAYGVVAKAKWVLRVHHELPEKPPPDPMGELLDTLLHRLDSQEQRIAELTRKVGGHPSVGGAGFETGAGEFMQLGSYSAAQMRRSVFAWAARTSANTPGLISGGLLSATDMQLSAAASGLVIYTSTGECLIPGTEATSQGGYHAFLSSQNSTTLATANATNPRIDLICATSADSSYTLPTGGTSGFVTINAVTGTPTSGATLSNLLGVATLPGSSLLLGYVLVPAAASNLSSGDISQVSTPVALGLKSVDSGWQTPTFLNSWGYYGSGQLNKGYRKIGNQVFFAFSISGGTFGSAVFSIPSAYAPYGSGLIQITGSGQIGTNNGVAVLAIPAGGGNVNLYGFDVTGSNGFWAFTDSYLID